MTTRAARSRPAPAPITGAATIVSVDEVEGATRVSVRVGAGGASAALTARVAQIPGYRPSAGDRVVVAGDASDLFVVAVVHASRPLALALPDGASAELRGDALELRDAEGRLLVRYAGGVAEISAPARDLRLTAPHGRVVVEAGTDIELHAARDVTHEAGRRLDLRAGGAEAPQVRVDPGSVEVKTKRLAGEVREGRLAAGRLQVFARSIATTAERVAENVGRHEITAGQIVERARDTLREVVDLAEARLGRARTVVRDVYTLRSRRSTLVSREETSVDGSKILLG